MIETSDIIQYDQDGFDGLGYIQMQREKILERISQFTGKLYLEVGGKFLYDPHAARVLPGFFPDSKKRIFSSLSSNADVIFCVNAQDILKNRSLSSDHTLYTQECMEMIKKIILEIWVTPKVAINRVTDENLSEVEKFQETLRTNNIESYLRYEISGYPENVESVLSKNGYWKDEYIETNNNLVLVIWAASGSGKLSTCLWQMYLDSQKWIDSWYAKYETFPVWNLHIDHPVNLAYEAATADIWDYNVIDIYHMTEYREESVNYNRDIEAFEIITHLAENFLPNNNYTRQYSSPTDMGISTAGFFITDEEIVTQACQQEIERRMKWYEHSGSEKAKIICENLLKKIHS